MNTVSLVEHAWVIDIGTAQDITVVHNARVFSLKLRDLSNSNKGKYMHYYSR